MRQPHTPGVKDISLGSKASRKAQVKGVITKQNTKRELGGLDWCDKKTKSVRMQRGGGFGKGPLGHQIVTMKKSSGVEKKGKRTSCEHRGGVVLTTGPTNRPAGITKKRGGKKVTCVAVGW